MLKWLLLFWNDSTNYRLQNKNNMTLARVIHVKIFKWNSMSKLNIYLLCWTCKFLLNGFMGLRNIFISCGRHDMETIMTSSNGDIFRVIGPLCGEFTGQGWIPLTKASDAELWCFFICAWIRGWINNREAGDLRCHRALYDVIVMHFPRYVKGIHQLPAGSTHKGQWRGDVVFSSMYD